jgi:hypothetical protein
MQINYPDKSGQLLTYKCKAGERCLVFSVYGDGGRSQEEISRHKLVMESQEKIFNKFDIPLNRFYHDFNYCGMGPKITSIVTALRSNFDYFIILDIDICPLRKDFIDDIIDKLKDKKTLFGGAQQSNHIVVNGSKNHLYASLSFFGVSTALYEKLGCPSFEYNHRGDVAEEIAWMVEERGYNLCLSFPSSYLETSDEEQKSFGTARFWDLGNGHKFGLATTYGDMVFHATMQSLPRSTELFIKKCEEILNLQN